jgi:hypothetical protein
LEQRQVMTLISRSLSVFLLSLKLLLFAFSIEAFGGAIRVPADYSTIQAAIDASLPGDTVLISDGTYKGPGNCDLDIDGAVVSRRVTVMSEHGPKGCIIDCEGQSRGVTFHGGVDSSFRFVGLTIKNGRSKEGGGIWIHESSPIIDGCILTRCKAERRGGGVYTFDSSAAIRNCLIEDNSTGHSGGGIWTGFNDATIERCIIRGNKATGKGDGAGIYLANCSASIRNCTISQNISAGSGGGIWIIYSTPRIINCEISGNEAVSGNGAGISLKESAPVIRFCLIRGNKALDGYGGGLYSGLSPSRGESPRIENSRITENGARYGGGVNCSNSSPEITKCVISHNYARHGGGIGCLDANPDITACAIESNEAKSYGGGMSCDDESSPSIVDCRILSNVSRRYGGGISCTWSSSPTIINSVVARNRADQGGGVYCYGGASRPQLLNCTLTLNIADHGGGVFCLSRSYPIIANSILWQDTPDEIDWLSTSPIDETGYPIIMYSDVEGGYPGKSNLAMDPMFRKPQGGDYHLRHLSPCIDAGKNRLPPVNIPGSIVELPGLPKTDLEGSPRIQGGKVDMGVYEYRAK